MMEARERRSSSNELSSAPNSDAEPPNFNNAAPQRPPSGPSFLYSAESGAARGSGDRGVVNGPGGGAAAASSATLRAPRQETPPVKQRKPRKKKDSTPVEADQKDKPARKPRAAYGSGVASRKKAKLENADNPNPNLNPSQFVAPATDLHSSKLVEPVSFHNLPPAEHHPRNEASNYSQNGLSNNPGSMKSYLVDQPQYTPNTTPQVPPTTTRSSAMYDPIRSIAVPRPVDPPQPALTSPSLQTPPRTSFGPSSSPSISSIINPPAPPPQPSASTPLRNYNAGSGMLSPFTKNPEFTVNNAPSSTMELDVPSADLATETKPSITKKPSSEVPTQATSPKPTRAKEQPPPMPMGSGLLSASLFGGESDDSNQTATEKGPSIVLHVNLKDPKNKVINFARLAEEKYGFAALYPRQAAQKERLARVAAAGAALERSASGSKFGGTSAGESADDDVSVDIDRESDNDGDVAMSGLNGAQDPANSGTDGPGPKRRRRRKVEEYDQDDPFVDDSEMLWEAQAAASKDGFFVYCGPLVPEGEKPAVERADGTVKRGRGRGRGGGPGSRGGRGGAAHADGGTGRGGGPGSRGGGITRKPRITKAERLARDQEKLAREKMAPMLAAKPAVYAA